MTPPIFPPPATHWLVRIASVFDELLPEIFRRLAITPVKTLGRGFHLVRWENPDAEENFPPFIRWKIPLHHSWPCSPRATDGFIEKAATALSRKFSDACLQTLTCGALDPGDPYHRKLASNLRGRALQLPGFEPLAGKQDPGAPVLFCLVGKEGLFAGIATPRAANGFHPGGTRFIRQDPAETISRAGAKIAEALHHLTLFQEPPEVGARWLELGAAPGGMTSELLARGYHVTAVDRAPLDPRITGNPALIFHRADATLFQPPRNASFAAILSDMNGDSCESLRMVLRFREFLIENGLIVFTLKLAGAESLAEIERIAAKAEAMTAAAGLRRITATHLTYNRFEFTWLLEPA